MARLSPEDREAVGRYLNDLGAEGYSAHRIMKIASNLTSVVGRMEVPLTKATAEDIKRWSAGLGQRIQRVDEARPPLDPPQVHALAGGRARRCPASTST